MAYFGRGKNKVQNVCGPRDLYNNYINNKEVGSPYYIEPAVYYKIINEFYKKIVDEILINNKTFKLPYRLGTVRVCKSKVILKHLTTFGVDWPTTIKLHKRVYHLNEHSSGYRYFFYWSRECSVVSNLFFYRLVMSRTNKRRLAKLIKLNKYDYYEK